MRLDQYWGPHLHGIAPFGNTKCMTKHFISLWSLGHVDAHLDVGSYLHTLTQSDLLASKGA